MVRRLVGEVLREQRRELGRTLREVSADARVSLGYISEIERGQKEASSECLAAICRALDLRMSELMSNVSEAIAVEEAATDAATVSSAATVEVGAIPAAEVGAIPAEATSAAAASVAELPVVGRKTVRSVAA